MGPQGRQPCGPFLYIVLLLIVIEFVIKIVTKIMANLETLIDRLDTIRANSVSDQAYEKTWGCSLDSKVKKSMNRWEELLAQAKKAIDERR